MKNSDVDILVEVIGGYQNADDAEAILAQGKADLIGAARAFFCDPDYYDKLMDGRGEDVLPCIRCNKCHVQSLTGHWISACSVNPRLGIEHALQHLCKPVTATKRVAIVGGGPAGMRCALLCRERGHQVTLYEKTDKLGGQLYHADYASFKWPVRNFRDYLIAHLEPAGVQVKLNTEATPEMLEAEGYDAVVVAIGATAKRPNIPGIEHAPWHTLNVFGEEHQLGKRVVVIGGSESGVETALYLCETGHDVTILSRNNNLAHDATPIHYRETIIEKWAEYPDAFHTVMNAVTTEIGAGYVKYLDAHGTAHTLDCDSVVALGGMQPLHSDAMQFHGCARQFIMIGDCLEVGNIMSCNRTAFAAASQI